MSFMQARTDHLTWDEYFMAIASLSAQRSKDPSTQVGACIVNAENKIVAVGYNGFPRGCSDNALPWTREGNDPLATKYPYVVHAEANAILNKNSESLRGCRIYVDLFPCNECAKLIIQSGITEVIYQQDKYTELPATVASKTMLNMAGIGLRQFIPAKKIVLQK